MARSFFWNTVFTPEDLRKMQAAFDLGTVEGESASDRDSRAFEIILEHRAEKLMEQERLIDAGNEKPGPVRLEPQSQSDAGLRQVADDLDW